MKIVVTGGAGFIGSEFVRQAVKNGHDVVVIDKLTYAGDTERLKDVWNNISFYKADITNEEFVDFIFEKEKPEAVVHFAAESHVDRSILAPMEFLNSNIIGTFVMLETARKHNVKLFINTSTDEVYGELRNNKGKFHESTPLNPNSPYSVSKASADMLGRSYYRTYKLPVITVRPSNNYGPWQYPEKFIPVIIARALRERPIPVYGDGTNVREWLYVSDCARAVLSIMEKGTSGETYNIASGFEKQNIDVVKTILNYMNKPLDLITFVQDRPGHDYRYSMDFKKTKEKIGWEPKVCFEEGIKKTVDWYIKHQDWLFNKTEQLKSYWNKVYVKKEDKK